MGGCLRNSWNTISVSSVSLSLSLSPTQSKTAFHFRARFNLDLLRSCMKRGCLFKSSLWGGWKSFWTFFNTEFFVVVFPPSPTGSVKTKKIKNRLRARQTSQCLFWSFCLETKDRKNRSRKLWKLSVQAPSLHANISS